MYELINWTWGRSDFDEWRVVQRSTRPSQNKNLSWLRHASQLIVFRNSRHHCLFSTLMYRTCLLGALRPRFLSKTGPSLWTLLEDSDVNGTSLSVFLIILSLLWPDLCVFLLKKKESNRGAIDVEMDRVRIVFRVKEGQNNNGDIHNIQYKRKCNQILLPSKSEVPMAFQYKSLFSHVFQTLKAFLNNLRRQPSTNN